MRYRIFLFIAYLLFTTCIVYCQENNEHNIIDSKPESHIDITYLDGNVLTKAQFETLDQTTIIKSLDSPTGYFVTFRYYAPQEKRVRIYGEWLFSDLADATIKTSTNATVMQWHDGYTVWKTSNWPIADMVLNNETGVWSYTIPLPCGTWNYKFYIGGDIGSDVDDYKGATVTWDPNNKPILYDYEAGKLVNEEYLSSIFVPYDPIRQLHSSNRMEEAPLYGQNGRTMFIDVTSSSNNHPARCGVYLPYQFDINRADPYPILILMHGGGGTESSWFNNGLINILDNMISQRRLEPMVVITPNGSDFEWNRPIILDAVVNDILPYAVKNFNVSTNMNKRAFGGLSLGGATTMYAYFHQTEQFQYYLNMSAPFTPDIQPNYDVPALKNKKLCITTGMYDFVKVEALLNPESRQAKRNEGSIYSYIFGLQKAGIPFTSSVELPYGHDWVLWRKNIVYMFDFFLWK